MHVYLSCFTLDLSDPAVRQCLRDSHDMHRTVMSGFDDLQTDTPRQDLGVLYRIIDEATPMRLYVMSGIQTDWARLPSGFSQVPNSPRDMKGVLDTLVNGRKFSFDLLAIPSKKLARENANSRRVFLAGEEERAAWLRQKAQQNGFAVVWYREDGQRKAFVGSRKDHRSAVHTGVRFRGTLMVIDETLFRRAFQTGIGAGKAYGMGMLMLFPEGR